MWRSIDIHGLPYVSFRLEGIEMRGYEKALQERSAGAVVFHIDHGKRIYLLLKHHRGHWDLPKGNIEPGEIPIETAKREILEETGLDKLRFYEGFVKRIEYYYRRREGLIHKVVVFFLSEAPDKDVKISEEHEDYAWLDFDDAIRTATFKNTKRLLKEAERYLNELYDWK